MMSLGFRPYRFSIDLCPLCVETDLHFYRDEEGLRELEKFTAPSSPTSRPYAFPFVVPGWVLHVLGGAAGMALLNYLIRIARRPARTSNSSAGLGYPASSSVGRALDL